MADYKSLHLAWLKSHKNFVPKHHHVYADEPYYDVLVEIYKHQACNNECARRLYTADQKWEKDCEDQIKHDTKMLYKNDPMAPIFVTIGFNHQTWNIPSCVKVIEKIVALGWIGSIHAVFELYRENGEHPHVHMLITPNEPITKSKVLEKIWRSAGLQRVCLKKSFIDYKVACDYHHKYITLEKVENKMEYVAKDIEWRSKNGIPENWKK